MKKLVIYRKKQFASALMPYWVVMTISKSEFMERFQLTDDISCCIDEYGQPVPRMEFNPQEYGVPISIGKTLELEINESIKSVFAVTMSGLVSNEIILNSQSASYQILVETKGGWKTPSYPRLTLEASCLAHL